MKIHDPRQGDLFEARILRGTSGPEVIPFPLARRRRRVAMAARNLATRKTETSRARYWHGLLEELSGQLRRHGAADDVIDRQLSEFYDAVCVELARFRSAGSEGVA